MGHNIVYLFYIIIPYCFKTIKTLYFIEQEEKEKKKEKKIYIGGRTTQI